MNKHMFIRILCRPFLFIWKHCAEKQHTAVHWPEENETIEQDIYCKLFHPYFADNYHQLPRNNCFSIFHFCRIYLKGLTGTAGKISSISQPGNDFSTKDADNDKCICKCSQMLTGGTNVFMFLSLPIFIGTEIVYERNSDNFDLVNFDY